MRNLFILFLLLGLTNTGFSQVVTFIDNETNEPLELVSLISYKPSIIEQTNALGQIDISAFEGIEQIQIILSGYEKQIVSYEDLSKSEGPISLNALTFTSDAVVVSVQDGSKHQ